MSKTKEPDWRTLPRKDPADKRDQRIEVRVSAIELATLTRKAEIAGVTLSEYLRNRGLGKKNSAS